MLVWSKNLIITPDVIVELYVLTNYSSWQGEEVEEFQRLCEVQSDKATIEITSRFKGKIIQIVFTPGDIVKVEWYLI